MFRPTSRTLPTTTFGMLLVVTAGALTPGVVSAQGAPQPGDRIRLVRADSPGVTEGTLVSLTREDLVYRSEEGSQARVGRASLEKLEVARRRSNAGSGLVLGSLVGFVVGVALESTAEEKPCTSFCVEIFDDSTASTMAGLGGAMLGGVGGLLAGALIKTHRWEPVIGPRPDRRPGAVGLGIRLRF